MEIYGRETPKNVTKCAPEKHNYLFFIGGTNGGAM